MLTAGNTLQNRVALSWVWHYTPCNPSILEATAGRSPYFQAIPCYINSSQPGLQSEAVSQSIIELWALHVVGSFRRPVSRVFSEAQSWTGFTWSHTAGQGQYEVWNHSPAFPGTTVPKPYIA